MRRLPPETRRLVARAAFGNKPTPEKAQLEAAFAPQFSTPWRPERSNRPQVEAYESKADLLLYGGAAGGGKTDLIIGLALAHQRSVIFSRFYRDLNGIEQRLMKLLGSRTGYNGTDMVLDLPGCLIEFGALERPGSELTWQGREHDFIGFDEGAQLDESKVLFVMSWLRGAEGQPRRVVIASNPPIGRQGEWLRAEYTAPASQRRPDTAMARAALLEVSSVLGRVVIQPQAPASAELH